MAVDTEAKRWSMLAFAGSPVRAIVFNPDTTGLSAIERATVLLRYGGNTWQLPVVGLSPLFGALRIVPTLAGAASVVATLIGSVTAPDAPSDE